MRLEIETRLRRPGGFALDVAYAGEAAALGIVGPSGSGKTTLLEVIAGIEPGSRVLLDGEDVSRVPLHDRRVGYVMQEALLFPHLTVRENLEFSPRAEGVERIATLLHIGHLLERMPRHLSGGERRRVALARALVSRPRLLLLDEPFSGLDDVLRREALSLLHEVRRTLGIPIVLVSHLPDEVVALTDRALRLDAGRMVAQGSSVSMLREGETRIDNHLTGTVITAGRVDVEGVELATVIFSESSGVVRLACYAHDIVLATARPESISARNVLPVKICGKESAGEAVLLTVEPPRLRVLITRGAQEALGLTVGCPAFAIIKATAITCLGAL